MHYNALFTVVVLDIVASAFVSAKGDWGVVLGTFLTGGIVEVLLAMFNLVACIAITSFRLESTTDLGVVVIGSGITLGTDVGIIDSQTFGV